jgi:archaeosine synthase
MSLFEAKRRDGLARIGEFVKEGDTIHVPTALDTEHLFTDLKLHPYSNIPLFAPKEFVQRFSTDYGEVIAAHPNLTSPADSGGCVMVSNWHTTLENPRNYVSWLITLKELHPPDTMWYAPASALPSNVAFLIYSGFDLFDFRAVDLQTSKGLFCTIEGAFPAEEWLDTGVCSCPGCITGDIGEHNRLALLNEIAVTRQFIAKGQIREFIEGRCRMNSSLVAALRLFDEAYPFFEQYTPTARPVRMYAHCAESIKRPEVKRFARRVLERFVPSRNDTCVLLPCSARKPYSFSQSHRKFQSAIQNRAHELIITSPLGLVPRELERVYPAAHYDVPVTGYWDREETAFITDILVRYLERNQYGRVLAHLDVNTLAIAQQAAEKLDIDLECTCVQRPTSRESLSTLGDALEGERKKRPDIIGGVISWQFGNSVDSSQLVVKGRFGNQKVLRGKEQFFSIDTQTGLFRPTFAGWKIIKKGYRVIIDDFEPKGDVLAPGILDADSSIRPGDEVLVTGPRAIATGKAVMGAHEMLSSKRGVAIRLRKVKKL